MSVRNLKASIKAGRIVDFKPKYHTKTLHTFDDCFVFIHGIQCWFFRKRNNRSFENMPTEKLAFHRDKLKSVISIYNELDSMIRKKS